MFHHGTAGDLHAVESAFEINVQDHVPIFFFHPGDEIIPGDAGIVNQNIQTAAALDNGIDGAADFVQDRDVKRQNFGPGPFGSGQVAGFGSQFEIGHIIDIEHHARFSQSQDAGSPDAPGGAGNQGHTIYLTHATLLIDYS